jgi:hypothetical protein
MPKTYISTHDRETAERERQNDVFCFALKTTRARLGKTYIDAAANTGVSDRFLRTLKSPQAVSNARFGTIRAVAHEIGMTKNEWLKLGGFE